MSGKIGRKILSDTTSFWKEEGHKFIKPTTGGEFPEGWDVKSYLSKLCDGKSITEIGCGTGRLSSAFQPEQYIGVDICTQALEIAEENNRDYKYILHNQEDPYPNADVRLVYTVLLHIDDDCIGDLVENLCEDTESVVVAEIMGRKWRRPGNPPVFNRETDEYITLCKKCGFELEYNNEKPYEKYKDHLLGPAIISFLRFKKKENKNV